MTDIDTVHERLNYNPDFCVCGEQWEGHQLGVDTAALLAEANAYAQRRFAAMLQAKAYSDPEAPETIAYIQAERVIDDLLGEAQWESSKAEFDRMQMADLDELAKGDHYAGMPR